MRTRTIVLIFVVVGFSLYLNSFYNELFWDDQDSILNNRFVQDWRYAPKYFSENLIAGAGLVSDYWRPALLLVFSLEWHLWGDWPVGYHLVSTALHVANAVFLFLVLFRIFENPVKFSEILRGNRALAFLTALVFLVHPLQTEAVTYAAGLADPLSAFFILSGLLFHLKSRYLLSYVAYVLALMSKETAIVMPALIFLVDLFGSSPEPPVTPSTPRLEPSSSMGQASSGNKLKTALRAAWPFLVLAAVYILLRSTVLNFKGTFNLYGEENIFTSNFHIRLFTFFRVLSVYFGLMFWPLDLHMERGVELATSLFSPQVFFGALLFGGLLISALVLWWKARRQPKPLNSVFAFGVLWFFIGLAPTSNLAVPVSGLLYEHWLYLPLVGIFLVVIWAGGMLGEKSGFKKVFLGALVVFLIFLSVLTVRRNRDWRDPITFYNQTLKYAPTSYRVINNLGMSYADVGDYGRAEESYLKAIELDPSNPVAYHNLGNTYRAGGRNDLAEENFKKAIELDPRFIFSYNALAALYLEQGRRGEALDILQKAAESGADK